MKYKKILAAFFTVFSVLIYMNRYDLLLAADGKPADQRAKEKPILDYKAKAGIISSIVKHCEWPPGSPVSKKSGNFIVGAFEEDEVVSYLIERAKDTKMKGKQIKVVILKDKEAAKGCHMLYITRLSKKRLNSILEAVTDLPILTVADDKSYAEKGVIISIFLTSKRAAFYLNHTALRKSGLSLPSAVVSLAEKLF